MTSTTAKAHPLQFAARRAAARRAAMARQKQKPSAVKSIDEICDGLSAVANDIADCLSAPEREAMRQRLEALENGAADIEARFPETDFGIRYLGLLSEFCWKTGYENAATLAQRVGTLKEEFDAGRPDEMPKECER